MADNLSPTPIQNLMTCLSMHTAGAALDGFPVGAVFEGYLQAPASGLARSGHQLKLLDVLLENWLNGLERDIGCFACATLPVLLQQKKALQRTHLALTELRQCLRALRQLQGQGGGLRTVAVARPRTWQRAQAMVHARAHRI